MTHRNRRDAAPFQTIDGSSIRELLNPQNSVLEHASLAEATLSPGKETSEHFHPRAEEIYYILRGRGRMRMEGLEFAVTAGDAIPIPSGNAHKIWNDGERDLVFLCACTPPYSDDDTVFTE